MNRMLIRLSLTLALVAACSLCAASWAGAATNYDTSFQNGGTLLLPQVSGEYGQVAQSCSVSGDHLNIAGRFGFDSRNPYGLWSDSQKLAVTSIKIRPRQPMMLGIASVHWQAQRIPTRHVVLGQSFDNDGGFAYATRSQAKPLRTKLKLFRVLPSGRRNPKFGHSGYISFTVPGFDSTRPVGFRVIALPAGNVFAIAQTSDSQYVLRFTRTGAADPAWGKDGVVKLVAPKSTFLVPGLPGPVESASVTPEGGLLITADNAPGKTSNGTRGLLKLTAAGNVASSWATDGYWTPPAPKPSFGQTAAGTAIGRAVLAANRSGGYAVLYTDIESFDGSSTSHLRLAYVDGTSGVTTLFNDEVGRYSAGGDGGTPDAQPWVLGPSSAGPIFARAESNFMDPDGTSLEAARYTTDTERAAARASFSAPDFAANALAVDHGSKNLYLCGSFGTTSKRASLVDAKREQRRAVAVRRVKL
jgi:hypothetical protein